MSASTRWQIAIGIYLLIIAGGFLGYTYLTRGGNHPLPVPPAPAPTSHIATIQSLAAKEPATAKVVGQGVLAFADVVGRDDSVVQTTGQLISAWTRYDTLLLQQTDHVGKLPGYSAAANAHLKAALGGNEEAPLDPAKRAAAVNALTQIADALGAR